MSLMDHMGNTHTSYEGKANLLYESYKDRLGTSKFTQMYFNLSSLITPRNELEWLEHPFLKEEIDNIIFALPSNKSPGLDGFNGNFLKKY